MALENLIKYGILINYAQIAYVFFTTTSMWPTVISMSLTHCFAIVSYLIELRYSRETIPPERARLWITINLAIVLAYPIVTVFSFPIHVVSASITSVVYLVLFLKLFSYHQVNSWCREKRKNLTNRHRRHRSGDWTISPDFKLPDGFHPTTLIHYPNNLNLKDLFYFVYAPTLCYELNFPRSERRRKMFILKRLFEVVCIVI